jgi:hypothetical protein
MGEDNKDNEYHQEIQAGQGNGILLPKTDRTIGPGLEGFFLVKELGA